MGFVYNAVQSYVLVGRNVKFEWNLIGFFYVEPLTLSLGFFKVETFPRMGFRIGSSFPYRFSSETPFLLCGFKSNVFQLFGSQKEHEAEDEGSEGDGEVEDEEQQTEYVLLQDEEKQVCCNFFILWLPKICMFEPR